MFPAPSSIRDRTELPWPQFKCPLEKEASDTFLWGGALPEDTVCGLLRGLGGSMSGCVLVHTPSLMDTGWRGVPGSQSWIGMQASVLPQVWTRQCSQAWWGCDSNYTSQVTIWSPLPAIR